ncbi:hypothetical protein [Bacteroides thetaiotaomicron]|uniref:hypothetical protein n=1 Tax=Bacteroides thetaiotaomicron TaxID=818 RepID=UPI0026E1C472|nr:hypothetical protein [Bacteroides thetaiotaomicron]MDO6187754.1 hypothetical protein [Bacteroides thetaiotaomicron]MDO6204390.1 hypothetical protein [Bacteroides thetaiotaomicron]MDO6209622.1 hypothetical protein [Bacteroides thetaiotaomicron]MDO6213796.1 hypothetical protein [Bacteroides thetaiotaomicron]MDO6222383.1 hypothetical protein [Bacteroides thetaiotaomicron]
MFAKRRIEPYVTPVNPSPVSAKDMLCSEFRQESPIDQFLFEELEFDGVKGVRLTSDIYMLFNQQRLDRLSRESLLSHFESMSVNEPKFGDLRSKLGDDQLISFVKSRFIQSSSELMAWSQYLMSSSDAVVAELAAAQQEQQSQQSQQSSESSASTE